MHDPDAKADSAAPKISFVSLGCPKALVDSERIVTRLRALAIAVSTADCGPVLLAEPRAVLVEVGPGQALGASARHHPAWSPAHRVLSSLAHPRDPRGDLAALLEALGGVWTQGVETDWEAFQGGARRRRKCGRGWRTRNRRGSPPW